MIMVAMKYCPDCGSEVDASDSYCYECGEDLSDRGAESPETEEAEEVPKEETESEDEGEESQDQVTEELTDIDAVGETKAEALRDAGYETVDDLREATQEEIAESENIGKALSARIKSNVSRTEVKEEEQETEDTDTGEGEDGSGMSGSMKAGIAFVVLVVIVALVLSAVGGGGNVETDTGPDSPDTQESGTTDGSAGVNEESAETDTADTETTDSTDDTGNRGGNSGNINNGEGQVSVAGNDYTPDFATDTMSVEYSANTVSVISPPDESYTQEPDEGNKFVVVRADVTIESEREGQVEVFGSVIALEAGGIIHSGSSIQGLPELTKTVVPGTTYEAWKYFEVPEDVTQATLTTSNPNAWFSRRTEIRFEQNEDLSARMSE
jgi:predicted flap endonuclease-1-like 5' DNA nuclease